MKCILPVRCYASAVHIYAVAVYLSVCLLSQSGVVSKHMNRSSCLSYSLLKGKLGVSKIGTSLWNHIQNSVLSQFFLFVAVQVDCCSFVNLFLSSPCFSH